jgi:hypothetical protein
MNITIAINGEGWGHLSRARALAEILIKSNDITFRAPPHVRDELLKTFPGARIKPIPCFSFEQRGFNIDYAKTITTNAGLLFSSFRFHAEIARELREEGTQMVLSDFEPFTSRAAKIVGIPVLQLNHPGIVSRTFGLSPSHLASRLVARYMMGHSDRTLICSFFGGDVGPIIREELRSKKVVSGDYFVVYQKKMYRDILEPVLEKIGRSRFRVFPDSGQDYAEALAGSAGLIAPAGHQSISEALALGKPVLAIPVLGQFEQELNAKKLRQSGFGDWCAFDDLPVRLPEFIERARGYETGIRDYAERVKEGKKGEWRCTDDTYRAAYLVECFMHESVRRPEWRRTRIIAPLAALR